MNDKPESVKPLQPGDRVLVEATIKRVGIDYVVAVTGDSEWPIVIPLSSIHPMPKEKS